MFFAHSKNTGILTEFLYKNKFSRFIFKGKRKLNYIEQIYTLFEPRAAATINISRF